MSELGLQVRAARKARKWKQGDLAKAAGVSIGTIQNLELGKRKTDPGNVIAIRQALDLEGDEVETRKTWPSDIQVIVNMIGQCLLGKSPEERYAFSMEMVDRFMPTTDGSNGAGAIED